MREGEREGEGRRERGREGEREGEGGRGRKRSVCLVYICIFFDLNVYIWSQWKDHYTAALKHTHNQSRV